MTNETIKFNDGELILENDEICTIVGETAHDLYFRILRAERNGYKLSRQEIIEGIKNHNLVLL